MNDGFSLDDIISTGAGQHLSNYDRIPQEMKQLDHWVCFRFEDRNGKRTKVPYNPLTGQKAKSNNKASWVSFAIAEERAMLYDGIGFMFTGSKLVGIDIDHCIDDNGVISETAQNIVKTLNSYTEYSPSGTGLHVICRATLPQGGNKNSKLGLEMYDVGRYFTVTGNVLGGYDKIVGAQNEINGIHQQFLCKPARQDQGNIALTSLDKESIILLASQSKQGPAFKALYKGEWQSNYQSQSEADLAFCNMLAYWTGRDPDNMDAIFRDSGLMRSKWDEIHGQATYGGGTIAKAIEGCSQVYNPHSWFPIVDGKGKPISKHWKNTEWLCNSLGLNFKYNIMTKRIEVTGNIPQDLPFESIVTDLMGVCYEYGFRVLREDLTGHIKRIAEQNKYNPVVNYLNECLNKWDGKSRIEQLFNCFVLDPSVDQNKDFILILFEKWLITCVMMAFNDGSKAAQGVLILKGPQGVGKTRWLFYMLPERSWGKDGVALDPTQKDDLLKALSYWIVELGEIRASIKREKLDRLKAFITESTDAIREPYGREVVSRPRNTTFLGTVNNDEFLKDETGERRYWVISVTDINIDDSLEIDQLWGEITHKAIVVRKPYWLSREEIHTLNAQNEEYKVISPEERALIDHLDWEADKNKWSKMSSSDLCSLLGFNKSRNVVIGRALKRLSTRGVICPTNNRDKRYTVPPLKSYQADYSFKDIQGTDGDSSGTDQGESIIQ